MQTVYSILTTRSDMRPMEALSVLQQLLQEGSLKGANGDLLVQSPYAVEVLDRLVRACIAEADVSHLLRSYQEAHGEIITAAAEALAAEGVHGWGDGGRLGDALLAIKDTIEDHCNNWSDIESGVPVAFAVLNSAVSDQDLKAFSSMLRALSGGRQLLILRYLIAQRQPVTVGQLVEVLDYARSAIQESLDILTDVGVLTFDRTDGLNYYRVNSDQNTPAVVGRLLDALFYGSGKAGVDSSPNSVAHS